MENKITDRERFTKIAELIPEYAEWAEKKIAQIDARDEKRKPTKAQLESIALEPKVVEALTADGQKAGAIATALGVSFQKVTPILTRLVEAGTAKAEWGVKGDKLYSLA